MWAQAPQAASCSGAGLGLVFVPCAGLILSAISVVAATHRIGLTAVALTVSYAAGVAVPLLAFALLSQRLAASWSALREHARAVRRASGAVIGVMAVVIATGAVAPLQTTLPGYAHGIEDTVPGGVASRSVQHLTGEGANHFERVQAQFAAASIPDEGPAAAFRGIARWLNTTGGRPITLRSLRGKVVLVDFWTYSCINCRRSLHTSRRGTPRTVAMGSSWSGSARRVRLRARGRQRRGRVASRA